MGHAKGEGNEVPPHRYPQSSCLRLGIGKDGQRARRQFKPFCDLGAHLLSHSSIPSKAMSKKLVLAQSRLQRKGRVGVFCTEQNDSGNQRLLSLCLTESAGTMFSVCVLQRVQVPLRTLSELLARRLDSQMRRFIFTHEAATHYTSEQVTSHDFFSELQGRPSPPGACRPEFQTLKLSPQPQVPLMLGLLNTNSLDSLSST